MEITIFKKSFGEVYYISYILSEIMFYGLADSSRKRLYLTMSSNIHQQMKFLKSLFPFF